MHGRGWGGGGAAPRTTTEPAGLTSSPSSGECWRAPPPQPACPPWCRARCPTPSNPSPDESRPSRRAAAAAAAAATMSREGIEAFFQSTALAANTVIFRSSGWETERNPHSQNLCGEGLFYFYCWRKHCHDYDILSTFGTLGARGALPERTPTPTGIYTYCTTLWRSFVATQLVSLYSSINSIKSDWRIGTNTGCAGCGACRKNGLMWRKHS